MVGIVLDGGREESVDEGGLAESGLASNLEPVAEHVSDRSRPSSRIDFLP